MPSKDHVEKYTDVATHVLAMCRKIQPDFWNPENNPDMASAWGYVFATKPFAPACYYEAVGVFYAENSSGDRPSPGQIVHFAQVVRDRWESDPVKRVELNAHRAALQLERDRQLELGRFGEVRGHRPREVVAGLVVEPSRVRQLLGGLGGRFSHFGRESEHGAVVNGSTAQEGAQSFDRGNLND